MPDSQQLQPPLTDHIKKGRPDQVQWDEKSERAFMEVKQLPTKSPVLKVVDMATIFVLQIDALDRGLGAALSQVGDDSISMVGSP